MIAFALLSLLQATPTPVDGLRDGEFVVGSTARTDPSTHFVEGRLIDASNGRPVAGAMLEGWTESFDMPAVLVDSALSGRDGTFRLRAKRDEHAVEKIRARSPLHRSTTLAVSDAYDEILLVPRAESVALRVLDFDDRPIAGATVRTHQTCNHAPPAVESRSDEGGRVATDDFPSLEDQPELQFSAAGFMSSNADDLASLAGASASATVWLPRIAPLRLRVLDAQNQAAAGLRVVLGAAPEWHSAFTDADGRVAFTAPFGERRFALAFRSGEQQEYLIDAWSPGGTELVVRRGGSKYERAASSGTAWLVLETRDDGVPLCAFHEQGWRAEKSGEHAFPPGRVRVLYGAPFSGWREQVVDIELHAGERRTLELHAQPEPRLHLKLPLETHWIVDVQAGSDSARIDGKRSDSIAVPPRAELIVMARNAAEVRRARRGGLESDGELSLMSDECVVQRLHPAIPPVELRFECDPHWHAHGRVRFATSEIELEASETGAMQLDLPSDTPFEAWFGAPGRVRACILGQSAPPNAIPVRLVARSGLVLRGNLRRVHAAGVDFERAADSSFALADIAPGPLDVHVERDDGSALELQLDLLPGETRELGVR